MISTTEHQQHDMEVQMKKVIYLDLPMRLRGSENNNFVLGLAINSMVAWRM
jgi:hypothetical protein